MVPSAISVGVNSLSFSRVLCMPFERNMAAIV